MSKNFIIFSIVKMEKDFVVATSLLAICNSTQVNY